MITNATVRSFRTAQGNAWKFQVIVPNQRDLAAADFDERGY